MTERRERTVIDRPVGTEVRVETMPGGVRITLIEPAAKPGYQERRR